jgi:endonuclease YncB( thermonuclease family)
MIKWLVGLVALVGLTGPVEAATVRTIIDGDTVDVNSQGQVERIRLACVDAPEWSQPLGSAATEAVRRLLPVGSTVSVVEKGRDRYGRVIGELYRNGTNVNLALVETGQAFVYWRYTSRCNRSDYGSAEGRAKRSGIGVWANGGTERPWEYRR